MINKRMNNMTEDNTTVPTIADDSLRKTIEQLLEETWPGFLLRLTNDYRTLMRNDSLVNGKLIGWRKDSSSLMLLIETKKQTKQGMDRYYCRALHITGLSRYARPSIKGKSTVPAGTKLIPFEQGLNFVKAGTPLDSVQPDIDMSTGKFRCYNPKTLPEVLFDLIITINNKDYETVASQATKSLETRMGKTSMIRVRGIMFKNSSMKFYVTPSLLSMRAEKALAGETLEDKLNSPVEDLQVVNPKDYALLINAIIDALGGSESNVTINTVYKVIDESRRRMVFAELLAHLFT